MEELKIFLKTLGFNSNETKVYLALAKLGEARASIAAKTAGLPRTTTAGILEAMADEGYVSTHHYRGVTYYWIEAPDIFAEKLEHKLHVARKLEANLGSLYRSEGKFPVARVLDTRAAISAFMEKMLLLMPKNSVICTIDDVRAGNYAKVLTPTDFKNIVSIKHRRDLITKTLVPFGEKAAIAKAKTAGQDIEIRQLPPQVDFGGSLWLAAGQLVHFGGTPPFATVVKHGQIVAGTQALWDYLWSIGQS